MRHYVEVLLKSILAGFCIVIGSTGYLVLKSYDMMILGAFVFALGLYAIIHFHLWLFTSNRANINKILWMLIKIAILPVIMGLGYEFIKYAGKHENIIVKILSYPGLLMQRITTVEPTDDIIEVAIESIKAVLTDNPEDDMIK